MQSDILSVIECFALGLHLPKVTAAEMSCVILISSLCIHRSLLSSPKRDVHPGAAVEARKVIQAAH